MPVGNVLVGNARGDIKHDNAALAVDVVSVSQPTEFFLTCGVPDVEVDLAEVLMLRQFVRGEVRRVHTVVKPRG